MKMKKIISSSLAALSIILSGCASYPTDPRQQAEFHANLAKDDFNKGQLRSGFENVLRAIELPDGDSKIRAMFAASPVAEGKFLDETNRQISQVNSIGTANECSDTLRKIGSAHLFGDKTTTKLVAEFDKRVIAGNESGSIPFVMDDEALQIQALASPKQRWLILQRTLDEYGSPSYSARHIKLVSSYVQAAGPNSREYQEFVKRLPTLNIRSNEIPDIALFDKDFAKRRLAELTLNAHLSVKNADRLFSDDLEASLTHEIRGVVWTDDESKGELEVVVEMVRDAEKELPISTRTVTYSDYQVDTLSAALLMPRNASYQYDLKTGGAEIEFGYVVSAWRSGKKISENVVRGKVGGNFQQCENARIVNVFGGVSAANFTANDDMRAACANHTPISLSALRSEVMEKISTQIRSIPEIESVHLMN